MRILLMLALLAGAGAAHAADTARAQLDAFAQNLHSLSGNLIRPFTTPTAAAARPRAARWRCRRRDNSAGTRRRRTSK